MALYRAKSDIKQRMKRQEDAALFVGEESQNRLAAILADAPSIVKFAGTEWEIKPLRFGTQYLIVNEMCRLKDLEHRNYDDAITGLLNTIPSLCKVLTLVLLNDKSLIYQNGDSNAGFSKIFKKTYETVMWNAERNDLGNIIKECILLIDTTFFMEALGMLQIFRASVTEKKRTRKKISGQK